MSMVGMGSYYGYKYQLETPPTPNDGNTWVLKIWSGDLMKWVPVLSGEMAPEDHINHNRIMLECRIEMLRQGANWALNLREEEVSGKGTGK